MDMEEIFQELLLSVGISVAVCCMIMKILPHADNERDETCTTSLDGNEDAGLSEKTCEEQPVNYGIGKDRRFWPLAEYFEQISVQKFYGANVLGHREVDSEVVEGATALQDLCGNKDCVGGIAQENCNVIDDSEVISDVIKAAAVSENLERWEEVVSTERLRIQEIEEESENSVEQRPEILSDHEIEVNNSILVDERAEKAKLCKTETGLCEEGGFQEAKSEGVIGVSGNEDGKESEPEKEGLQEEGQLFDDWEGIERTELEKLFGAAVVFVGSKSNADLIDRDLKIELYGLHKIAIEGPCRGAQPMALNVSARAKWNSWQRLGNMSRELAMEQYLLALSERIPGWMISDSTEGSY